MPPAKLRLVTASGSHSSCGKTIGKKTSSEIKSVLKKFLPDKRITESKEYKRSTDTLLRICETRYPQYLRELKGIAEGARVSFTDLFILNTRTELKQLTQHPQKPAENCTTLLLPKEDRVIIGHNEDGYEGNHLYMLNAKYTGEPRLLALCYAGRLPGIAISLNSEGLFFTLNSLNATDTRPGIPLLFHARSTITAKSIQAAKSRIIRAKRARGENFILCKGRQIMDVETSASKTSSRRVSSASVHTNHYLHECMRKFEDRRRLARSSSQTRLTTAQGLLERRGQTLEDFKRILSNHSNAPKSICVHGFNDLRTLATILHDTKKKSLMVAKGNPCKARFYTYRI